VKYTGEAEGAEMRSKSYIARWKNFLNFLTQMFDTSSIVALAGNVPSIAAVAD